MRDVVYLCRNLRSKGKLWRRRYQIICRYRSVLGRMANIAVHTAILHIWINTYCNSVFSEKAVDKYTASTCNNVGIRGGGTIY